MPLRNKHIQISNILNKSKRSPLKRKSDRGAEIYDSIFENFLKGKNVQHFSRFTDERPPIAERVIRTIRNLIKKPVFGKGNAGWLSELTSVIKLYNNTIHNSTKMKPNDASTKSNENEAYSNLRDGRVKQKPKFKLGDSVRTSDNTKVFSIGDSTNWS